MVKLIAFQTDLWEKKRHCWTTGFSANTSPQTAEVIQGVYKSDSVVSPLWTLPVASTSSLFASELVTHWDKAKQGLWRNVVKRQWFDAQITRLLYVNHWWTQKNHFSGNTSTRWLFVDHVPRINVILEILAFKERGKGENKHTCRITIRSYGWWFHCTIAPNFSHKIKVN